MTMLKQSCFLTIVLCTVLLLAACISGPASKPEESAGTESLPAESGGETTSCPVDTPYMLNCSTLEELFELQSMLEKSEQEVYEYLRETKYGMMAGISSKAELAALLEKICSMPFLYLKAETGYVIGGITYYIERQDLHIGYESSLSEGAIMSLSCPLPSDSMAAAESADTEYADSLTVGDRNIGLYLSESNGTYDLFGRLTASGHVLRIRIPGKTVDPNLRGSIEVATLNEVLSDFCESR